MFCFLGYNKDADRYDELLKVDSLQKAERSIPAFQSALSRDELRDAACEPYDWVEVWDEEDDNGINDIYIYVNDVVYGRP